MAAYQHVFQQTTSKAESPAKVFAKLKSKVDREASCGKDGVYTRKDLLGKVKEKHGAEFMSPRKRTDPYWTTDELDENRGFGFVCEAQALTISPMSSPQSDFGCSHEDWSRKHSEDALSVGERRHACTPMKGGFLESTVRSQPFHIASRTHSHTEAPEVRDRFDVIRRTQQQKIQTAENEFLQEVRTPLTAPSSVFSPMRSKLRKRTLQSSGLHNESCPFGEVQTFKNTQDEDLTRAKRLPSRRFDKNQTMFPAQTRGSVVEDKVHLMSPAKMFAYMKERESKPEQHEGRRLAGSRNLFGSNRGNFHKTTSPPVSTDEEEDPIGSVNRKTLSSQSDAGLADSQSDTDLSDDVRVPAVLSQRVLLEDPLILNSPQVSIPKKHRPVFKNKNWPQSTDFPCENGIHLSRWFLRRKGKDLFVEGIHREKNIPWNSNIIVDRISNFVLKTATGSVYILDGRMNLSADTGFPKWFLKKFHSGFPSNWSKLLEKFLSARKKEKNSMMRSRLATSRSESNFIMPPPSITRKVTESVKTPDNNPPAPPTSTKVSRSGRVIKPPLEYWKGGRVLIDAHMNVTIHESYDTSLCNPEANATMILKPSARLFSPCNNEPSKPAAARETTEGPLRKTAAPVPRRNRARAARLEKPSHPPKASSKPHRRRISSSSSEGECGSRLRSSQRGGAVVQTLRANGNACDQEKPSTLRKPRKQQRDGKKPPVASSQRQHSGSASRRSPAVGDASSDDQPPPNELIATQRSRRRNEVRSYREESPQRCGKASKKASRPPRSGGAAKASEEKQSKVTKTSGRAKPKQSSRRRKANSRLEEEEEGAKQDKWTESELMKLNEAVKLYPRHMGDLWAKVAKTVGTRSAEECHLEHTLKNVINAPVRKQMKQMEEAKQQGSGSQVADAGQVVISARVGTLRRKKQVRQFLENMPKDDHDDIFTLAAMKNKAFERAAACPFSTTNNHEFTLSNLGPLTPNKASYPLVKTPHALPISPNMLGSPNCAKDDKFVYHLQKKVKKNQVNVCKLAPVKTFKLTPSVKRAVKRCGNTENDNFVVWEMFPGKDSPIVSDSEEEKDFYFSDDE